MDELVDSSRYSPQVVEHFESPRHAGMPAGANRRGESCSASRGAKVSLWLREAEGRVEAAGFCALGCPHAIAAADLVCEDLVGRDVAALVDYQADFLESALPLPAAKLDLKILLEDAVRDAVRQEET